MGIYETKPWLKAIDPLVPREYELPEMPVYNYLTESFQNIRIAWLSIIMAQNSPMPN